MRIFSILGAALWFSIALLGTSLASERITNFGIKLIVQPNSDLIVTEIIEVVAEGDEIERGIYRDFPTAYRTELGFNDYVDFDVLEVTRNGEPEPHFVDREEGYHRLYIGNPSKYVSRGAHAYKITYRTNEQIGFFADADELYWNLTGSDWVFPIESVTAELILPEGAQPQDISAYTGEAGAQGTDYEVLDTSGNRVALRTTRTLQSGEGITVSVSWQKGLLVPPTRSENAIDFVEDNMGFASGCLCLFLLSGYFYYVWRKFGKDPEKGTVIPLFEPPASLSAIALGYIHARGFNGGMSVARALAVGMTSLAIKGFVTIEDLDKRSGDRYIIRRTKKAAADLPPGEEALLNKLFDEDDREELALGGSYNSTFSVAKTAFTAAIRNEYGHAYFRTNGGKWFIGAAIAGIVIIASAVGSVPVGDPMILAGALAFFSSVTLIFFFISVRLVWGRGRRMVAGHGAWPFVTSLLILFGAALPTGLLGFGVSVFVSLPIFLLIAALVGVSFTFFDFMEAPTVYGRQIMDKIDGYILFLTTTEWDRMKAEGAMPTPSSAMFEKHLPYSMALGVDDAWSKTFANYAEAASVPVSDYKSPWYNSRRGPSDDISTFSRTFASGLVSTMSSASTPPPSSSSGSSGGGSSGGGGGGGGGGGW